MSFDRKAVADNLEQWESSLVCGRLPCWDELPALDLYMDQVIILLSQYLSFIPLDEEGGRIVTSGVINSYVRQRIIPPPQKKKYTRTHMAYLIMICILKQSLTMPCIQKILPCGLEGQELAAVYNNFAEKHSKAAVYFAANVKNCVSQLTGPAVPDADCVENILIEAAVTANLYSLLTEKIADLNIHNEKETDMIKTDS